MKRTTVLLGATIVWTLGAFGCGKKTEPAPAKATANEDAILGATFPGFQFAPTFEQHKPEGTELVPVAEIGLPHAARMKAVVATHRADRDDKLLLELWTFEQQGKEDVLAPSGALTTLLSVAVREGKEPVSLGELRRDLAAPRTVVGRPQGLDVESPELALERLHDRAKAVREEAGTPSARVGALAEFVRGLDNDLWLSHTKLPFLVKTLADGSWQLVGEVQGTKYRKRMRAKSGEGRPEFTIAFLRKRDGWVLQQFEQRR